MGTSNSIGKSRKRFWTRERLFQIGAIVLTIAVCTTIVVFRDHILEFKEYGYVGLFLISILVSSSIVIPVPGMFIVAAMGAVLNPVLVGIVSAAGGTIGEMTGYMLGYGGRIAVHESPMYCRIEGWMKKWGSVTIFLLALIPNPFFDIAGAAAGVLRFPVWKFLVAGFAGRLPKQIGFAFGGVIILWYTELRHVFMWIIPVAILLIVVAVLFIWWRSSKKSGSGNEKQP
jgi:uncharacterized membrane protein YdjX (TVP38/TMEM64 family)